jgi:hypothetical protein
MSTKNMAYDHAAYIARLVSSGEAGGAATTQYTKFTAFTAMLAFSAQMTVTVAGTAAGGGFALVKEAATSGALSTYSTSTFGTSTAGTTTNVLLSTAAGGVVLNQGDVIYALSLADATGKVGLTWELGIQPLGNVTV